MRPPRHVEVPPSAIKPGDRYEGYNYANGSVFSSIVVGEDGIPRSWGEYELDKEPTSFLRNMTWEEEARWYRNRTDMTKPANQLNLMGIHTDLASVGDASHEMYNGWIKCDWSEQLVELVDEDFFIVGIAEAPYGCWSLSDPVAVVAESRKTGDRFWCHAGRDWIEEMREDSESVYRELMNGKM